jgi:multisubunit Na+/H+ antiporter MnhB subunit
VNSPQPGDGMSMIVKTVCGWVKGFILLYGIHIILYGRETPGGGFAGGVIAASSFVLITLAEGEQAAKKTFQQKTAAAFTSLGALLFWLMAVLGIVVTGVFFANFRDHFIDVCEVGIGLLVCSSLYLILTALHARTPLERAETKGDPP